MASTTTVILDYYGPGVFTACIVGLIALFREIRKSRIDAATKLNNLIHQLEMYRERFDSSRIELDRLLREFPPVKEGLAVLAAEFENHERYHERHNI